MEGRLQYELGQQDGLKTELQQKENRKTIERDTMIFWDGILAVKFEV